MKFEPCHKKALNNLGLLYDAQGASEKAVELYTEAIRLDPNHSVTKPCYTHSEPHFQDALNNLGANRTSIGLLDEAIALFNRAIKVDSQRTEPHFNMAIALTKLDRRDDAIRHYQVKSVHEAELD